jgi:hypothetical protein
MKTLTSVGFTALVIAISFTVCRETVAQNGQSGELPQGSSQRATNSPSSQRPAPLTKEQVAQIKENLAKLSAEDRELAIAQGYCPIMLKNRLGLMGTPIKVTVNDQPVFICCKGCTRKALANPERTLQIVAQLQINESLANLSPKDRQLAVAQGYCPVMRDNPLGVMGTPVKVMLGNEPVFLCCAGCKRRALANPNQTLAIVTDLRTKVAEEAARSARIEARPTQR